MKPGEDFDIEILRTGQFKGIGGVKTNVTAAALDEMVASYSEDAFAAPLVLGHPKTNGPAYGWVKGLKRVGDKVVASVSQVPDSIRELVRDGHYRNVSASYYQPNVANNPTPGKNYLRHVGLLGATAPAIKGLKAVGFADDADDTVEIEFSESEGASVTATVAALHTIIDRLKVVMPQEQIDAMLSEDATRALAGEDVETIEFGDVADTLTEALDARLASLMETETTSLSEAGERSKSANVEAVHLAISQGRMAPFMKDEVIEFLDSLEDVQTIEFSEGLDGPETISQAEKYRRLMLMTMPIVSLGEHSRADIKTNHEHQTAPQRADAIKKHVEKAKTEGRSISFSDAADELGYFEETDQ